jgi:hypothetical protein
MKICNSYLKTAGYLLGFCDVGGWGLAPYLVLLPFAYRELRRDRQPPLLLPLPCSRSYGELNSRPQLIPDVDP